MELMSRKTIPRGRPLSGTVLRCRAAAVGMSVCRGVPDGQVCCARETLVSGACRPSVFLQAGGLVAVGQRLAPVSKARTNYLKEETLVNFSLVGTCMMWMRDVCEVLCGEARVSGITNLNTDPADAVSRAGVLVQGHMDGQIQKHVPFKPVTVGCQPVAVGLEMFVGIQRDGKSRR